MDNSASKAWSNEYTQKGIPSSFRNKPSGAVEWFVDFLNKKNITSGRALDLGAGKGRNSLFLAKNGFQVNAIDFVATAIEELNDIAKAQDLAVRGHAQNVTEPLPFEDETFDIVIDIFCYKHQTDKEKQQKYREELHRVLKNDGYYCISLSADDDGYYSQFLNNSPEPENKMIIDPAAGVASYLYTKEELEQEFKPSFTLVNFDHKRKKGIMHEEEYKRSTIVFIFKKSA